MQYAIIVAGGRGTRMGTEVPKQFLPIAGRPVLMHTLDAFVEALPEVSLVVVLPEAEQDAWQELCRKHGFDVPHAVVSGGQTRFHSVLSGLQHIVGQRKAAGLTSAVADSEVVVGVHDGVRPLVSVDVVRRCYAEALVAKAVVPVVPVVETVRELLPEGYNEHVPLTASRTVPRDRYRLVQTPQTFTLDILLKAYSQPYRDAFTDDASVVEAMGQPVTLVAGNRENIKLTTPFDLVVAEGVMKEK